MFKSIKYMVVSAMLIGTFVPSVSQAAYLGSLYWNNSQFCRVHNAFWKSGGNVYGNIKTSCSFQARLINSVATIEDDYSWSPTRYAYVSETTAKHSCKPRTLPKVFVSTWVGRYDGIHGKGVHRTNYVWCDF